MNKLRAGNRRGQPNSPRLHLPSRERRAMAGTRCSTKCKGTIHPSPPCPCYDSQIPVRQAKAGCTYVPPKTDRSDGGCSTSISSEAKPIPTKPKSAAPAICGSAFPNTTPENRPTQTNSNLGTWWRTLRCLKNTSRKNSRDT